MKLAYHLLQLGKHIYNVILGRLVDEKWRKQYQDLAMNQQVWNL